MTKQNPENSVREEQFDTEEENIENIEHDEINTAAKGSVETIETEEANTESAVAKEATRMPMYRSSVAASFSKSKKRSLFLSRWLKLSRK